MVLLWLYIPSGYPLFFAEIFCAEPGVHKHYRGMNFIQPFHTNRRKQNKYYNHLWPESNPKDYSFAGERYTHNPSHGLWGMTIYHFISVAHYI